MALISNLSLFVCALVWAYYSLLEGYREGWHWHYKATSMGYMDHTDAHTIFSMQRLIVAIMVVMFYWTASNQILFNVPLFICLCFPFLHDGAYYYHRNILNKDVYPKRFFDQSDSSTALLTKFFPPIIRVVLFIVGVFMLMFKF